MVWHSTDKPSDKNQAYDLIREHFSALINSEANQLDTVAKMSMLVSLLYHLHPSVSWAGFYRLVGNELLVVGPYCGTPACLTINIARGVCGQCARARRTIIVPDVHAFTDHIVCDASSRSEIVVPLIGLSGSLIAVLDLDSTIAGAFDADDAKQLEAIIQKVL